MYSASDGSGRTLVRTIINWFILAMPLSWVYPICDFAFGRSSICGCSSQINPRPSSHQQIGSIADLQSPIGTRMVYISLLGNIRRFNSLFGLVVLVIVVADVITCYFLF